MSAEVIATDFDGMIREGEPLAGLHLMSEIRQIYDNFGFETQILSASIRHTMYVIDCAKIGSDVMMGPLSSIMGLLKHPLTDMGLAKFLEDYKWKFTHQKRLQPSRGCHQ